MAKCRYIEFERRKLLQRARPKYGLIWQGPLIKISRLKKSANGKSVSNWEDIMMDDMTMGHGGCIS